MKTYKRFISAALVAGILAFPLSAAAQLSRSIWFLDNIPQANRLNPGYTAPCNFYVSLPYISSFYMGFESPFSFDELTAKYPGDSLYIDREGVLGELKEHNYFSYELNNEFLHSGFRLGKNWFHASISKVFTAKLSFTKDLADFFLYGNGSERMLGKTVRFDNTGLNFNSYHEFAAGYTRQFSDRLSVGITCKYLNGSFNFWTKKSEFSFFTDTVTNYAITAQSDVLVNTSSTVSDFDNMIDQIIEYGWFDLSKNNGFAFDIGAQYKLNDKFSFAASVLDMGKIKWKENVKNYRSSAIGHEFTFAGFDLNDIFNKHEYNDSLEIMDTIRDKLGLEIVHESYTAYLNPKIYLSSEFMPSEGHHLFLMIRSDIVKNKPRPSLSIAYRRDIKKFLSLVADYSIMGRSYTNLGLGFQVKMGPVQIYVLNDNFYALFDASASRNYNFHFGINFIFGKQKQKAPPGETGE